MECKYPFGHSGGDQRIVIEEEREMDSVEQIVAMRYENDTELCGFVCAGRFALPQRETDTV